MKALPAVLLLCSLLAGCATPAGPATSGAASTSASAPAPLVPEPCSLPAALDLKANPHVTLATTEGDIILEVFRNEAPVTAGNFLSLVRSGHYNGTVFHRIIKDFMMQGGDGARAGKADAPAIPDEFHRLLRMDGRGIVAMANAGPNTGSDQFFITFKETGYLNDKHAVFAKVVGGMDVVDKINGQVAGGNDGVPKRPVTLTGAVVREQATQAGPLGLALTTPDGSHAVPQAGGDTQFLLVAENKGDRLLPVCVAFTPPAGVSARSEPGFANFQLPAKQRVAFVVEARMNGTAAMSSTLGILLETVGSSASLNLTLAKSASVGPRTVKLGDSVTANYIGYTVDGRVFDTSVKAVGDDAKAKNLGYGGFAGRPSYSTFSFKPGTGVIQGFTDLAVGTHAGGKSAARIPPEDAYGSSGHDLAGRTLLFQLEVVSIK